MADVESKPSPAKKAAAQKVGAKDEVKKAGKSVGAKKAAAPAPAAEEPKAAASADKKKVLAADKPVAKSTVTRKAPPKSDIPRRSFERNVRVRTLGEKPLMGVSHSRMRSMAALYNIRYLDKSGCAALREIADAAASKIVDAAIVYAEHGRRRTVTKQDMMLADDLCARNNLTAGRFYNAIEGDKPVKGKNAKTAKADKAQNGAADSPSV